MPEWEQKRIAKGDVIHRAKLRRAVREYNEMVKQSNQALYRPTTR